MSIGYTGLILNIKGYLNFFNKKIVNIYVTETFETSTTMTVSDRFVKKQKFDSKFRALMFIARLNKKQFNKYDKNCQYIKIAC